MNLLQDLGARLEAVADIPSAGQQTAAAVLIAITRGREPELLLTRRAAHLNSHGYQIAFPGGKWEPGDADLLQTALRETREEIALDPGLVEVQGRLRCCSSRQGVEVHPFVGLIPERAATCANPAEIDSIFQVPLAFFLDQRPHRIDHLQRDGARLEVPAWHFGDYEIWGLTALIIQDLCRRLRAS